MPTFRSEKTAVDDKETDTFYVYLRTKKKNGFCGLCIVMTVIFEHDLRSSSNLEVHFWEQNSNEIWLFYLGLLLSAKFNAMVR